MLNGISISNFCRSVQAANVGRSCKLFDATRAAERNPKENTVEDAAVLYAKRKGVLAEKVRFGHSRGVADRMFVHNGRVMFIEFKRPKGGSVAQLQKQFRKKMLKHRVAVVFCDNIETAKGLIDDFIAATL